MSKRQPPPPPADSSAQSRNQYIPSFISERPFWAPESTSDADYLEHQRLQATPKDTLDKAKWYDRGRKSGPAATKFRKGACENCGAMTHKTKECLSRPRKQGAKWTGRDIQADEVIEDVKLGWDAKRDRWNGYDAREYSAVVQEYEELEAMKKAAAAGGNSTDSPRILENGDGTNTPTADSDARYGEETDMGRSQPTSTRQLRLREDTAKYLLNLDLDSARYDPKTRSMDTSSQTLNNKTGSDGADEGFVRPAETNDDAAAFEKAQKYAWETQESSTMPPSSKIHLQANPTEGAFLLKKAETESKAKKEAQQKFLADKYGDQTSHNPSPAQKALLNKVTANERYVEYDEKGHIKGQIHSVPRSKYAEDVYTNNHTSVWGSWWRNFQWGYACCHSTVKNSYCTGEEGRRAFEETEGMRTGQNLLIENGENEDQEQRNGVDGIEAVVGNEKEKLELEQRGEDIRERKDDGDTADQAIRASKKRTLQEIQSGISEEELESYKRNRRTADDPMGALLGKDELLPT